MVTASGGGLDPAHPAGGGRAAGAARGARAGRGGRARAGADPRAHGAADARLPRPGARQRARAEPGAGRVVPATPAEHARRGRSHGRTRPQDLDLGPDDPPAGDRRFVPQARSADPDPQPGDVHRRGGQRPDHAGSGCRSSLAGDGKPGCSPARSRSGSGSRSCSPTSPRRWRKAAARRRPRRCAGRRPRRPPCACATARARRVPASALRSGDVVRVEAGQIIPGDGEIIEGVGERRRVGDHRRVGAGDPRGGRRPLRGHRRHARAVGLDPGAHHVQPRRDLPRPDDRAGRGRGAAEDAQRDRAQHPAGRADARLPARRRDAASRSRATPARPFPSRC